MSTLTKTPVFTLADRLKKSRLDAGFDQITLAAALGLARNTLSNYETARTIPPFDITVMWARACGVSLDWLAEGVETNEKAPAANGEGQESRLWDLNPRPVLYEGTALPTELKRRGYFTADDFTTVDALLAEWAVSAR